MRRRARPLHRPLPERLRLRPHDDGRKVPQAQHDHSLQVIGQAEPTDPRYSIVSGSRSKLTNVGTGPELRFARSAPGYMRLLIKKDGGMHLSVVASPERYLRCPEQEPALGECMREGAAAFETVFSKPLR